MFISDEVTRGLDFVYTYIDDDLLIASGKTAEHEHHLRQHLERFQQYGVVINPAKSVFGVATIQFLGHSHPGHGIQPVESKVQAISDFPLPPTLFLLSFYSLMFPYRSTTHRYATILHKIVGTLSNLIIKFHVPCKNIVHPPPPPSPLLNVAVGETTSYMFSSTLIRGRGGMASMNASKEQLFDSSS